MSSFWIESLIGFGTVGVVPIMAYYLVKMINHSATSKGNQIDIAFNSDGTPKRDVDVARDYLNRQNLEAIVKQRKEDFIKKTHNFLENQYGYDEIKSTVKEWKSLFGNASSKALLKLKREELDSIVDRLGELQSNIFFMEEDEISLNSRRQEISSYTLTMNEIKAEVESLTLSLGKETEEVTPLDIQGFFTFLIRRKKAELDEIIEELSTQQALFEARIITYNNKSGTVPSMIVDAHQQLLSQIEEYKNLRSEIEEFLGKVAGQYKELLSKFDGLAEINTDLALIESVKNAGINIEKHREDVDRTIFEIVSDIQTQYRGLERGVEVSKKALLMGTAEIKDVTIKTIEETAEKLV